MKEDIFDQLSAALTRAQPVFPAGQICEIAGNVIKVSGLSADARVGDRLRIIGTDLTGEVVRTAEKY